MGLHLGILLTFLVFLVFKKKYINNDSTTAVMVAAIDCSLKWQKVTFKLASCKSSERMISQKTLIWVLGKDSDVRCLFSNTEAVIVSFLGPQVFHGLLRLSFPINLLSFFTEGKQFSIIYSHDKS